MGFEGEMGGASGRPPRPSWGVWGESSGPKGHNPPPRKNSFNKLFTNALDLSWAKPSVDIHPKHPHGVHDMQMHGGLGPFGVAHF